MFELIGVRNEGGWIPSFPTGAFLNWLYPKMDGESFRLYHSKSSIGSLSTSFDSGIYTILWNGPTYHGTSKDKTKDLPHEKKRIQSLRHLNQILVHTPPPTQPAPLPTWQTTAPPSKKGLRVFQPTILTWHSVKKVKYSSPSFCTLNRPHLSDISSPSPLVSIRWYDDRGRMISTWRGTVDAQKKINYGRNKWLSEWTTTTSPFLFFLNGWFS